MCVKNKEETRMNNAKVTSEIIFNNMFPAKASYLNNYDNIGHETINLFQADDGKCYLYLNSDGGYGEVADNNIVVLNIVKVDTSIYQVISKAVDCKNYKNEEIRYGNVEVEDYFENNKNGSSKYAATFKCEIYKVDKPIYIKFAPKENCTSNKNNGTEINAKNIVVLGKTKTGRGHWGVKDESDKKELNKIIDEEKYWSPSKITKFDKQYTTLKTKSEYVEDYFSFLGVEKSELAYSNALVNILKFDTNYVTNFLGELLGKNCKENNFEILREEKNIDILFRDLNKEKGKIVIIENKIDAGITLSDGDKTVKEQMEKKEYYKGEKDIRKFFCEYLSMNASQLSKYYIIAVGWAVEAGWSDEKIKEDIYCYFLCPEYHKLIYKTKNDNGRLNIGLACDDKYTLITYETLYKLFSNDKKLFSNDKKFPINLLTNYQRWLFDGYVQAISQLAKTRDDSMELKMIRMFIQRYDELKAKVGSKI